jgi:hypothetical protein
MNGTLLKIVVTVCLGGLITWGAWNTLATSNAVPKPVFDAQVEKTSERFESMQIRIEDKIDKVQETILDLHK